MRDNAVWSTGHCLDLFITMTVCTTTVLCCTVHVLTSILDAGTVTIFNAPASATPYKLAEQFARYGDVKDVREDPQIQGCWLVEYYDIRHASLAHKATSRGSSMHATLPVVSEVAASQPSQQPLRNVQSSHVLHSDYGSSNQLQQGEEAWQGPRSWDNQTGAAFQEQLASLMLQRNGEQRTSCTCLGARHSQKSMVALVCSSVS